MSALHDYADAVIQRARRAQSAEIPVDLLLRIAASLDVAGDVLRNGAPVERQVDIGLECRRLVAELRRAQEPQPKPQRAQVKAWAIDPDAPAKWARQSMDRETHDFYFGE